MRMSKIFCLACEKLFEDYSNTFFARITASPEVLAEKLVYQGLDGDFHSSIIEGGTRAFPYETEAIAATVAKLKGVEK